MSRLRTFVRGAENAKVLKTGRGLYLRSSVQTHGRPDVRASGRPDARTLTVLFFQFLWPPRRKPPGQSCDAARPTIRPQPRGAPAAAAAI